MRIYVDDSGDPGTKFRHGSTLHLCIGCVLVNDYAAAERIVERFRARRGWATDREIKWSKSDERTRMEFLRCLDSDVFRTCSLVIDKRQRPAYTHIKKRAYEHALIRSLEHALEFTDRVVDRIIIDQRDEDKSMKREVERHVRQTLNAGGTRVREVSLRDSRHEAGLQIADMVVGESHFTARTGDTRYRNLTGSILTEYTWP